MELLHLELSQNFSCEFPIRDHTVSDVKCFGGRNAWSFLSFFRTHPLSTFCASTAILGT